LLMTALIVCLEFFGVDQQGSCPRHLVAGPVSRSLRMDVL
jgi:hypothetical protein